MGWTWDLNLGLNQRLLVGYPPTPAPPRGVCVHTRSSPFPCVRVCVPPPVTSLRQHTGPETFNGRATDWSAISLGRLRN